MLQLCKDEQPSELWDSLPPPAECVKLAAHHDPSEVRGMKRDNDLAALRGRTLGAARTRYVGPMQRPPNKPALSPDDFIERSGDWSAEVVLPSWRGFQDRRGPYSSARGEPSDGTVSLSVERDGHGIVPRLEAEMAPVAWALEHEREMHDAILAALLEQYRSIRPKYRRFLGDRFETLMPEVTSIAQFRDLLGLDEVFVHPPMHEGLPLVGFMFGCSWDVEHGLGVIVHGLKVGAFHGAEAAFNFWHPGEKG